ncbi:MAG: hypothetical protein EBV86_03390 [Marivivens sp.]|nr:hypothetical protein [Marivivens sp.]
MPATALKGKKKAVMAPEEEVQEEEMREGSEEEEPMATKDTEKQAKKKDGEGCNCKTKKGRKKMDSLTAGMFRNDARSKKCGGGWISFNKKCRQGVGAKEKAEAKKEFKKVTTTFEGARKFSQAKANTKGLGNKIKRAGEVAARIGGAASAGVGYAQMIEGAATGNAGKFSRGLRNYSLGASAIQLSSASKAARMGKKGLRNEFLKSARNTAAFGVGQEAALGAYAGFKRSGGMRNLKRRARGAYQGSRVRASGLRRYRDGETYASGFNVDYSRLKA